jgi:hypothetical protein
MGAPQLAQNALPTLLDCPHWVHITPDIAWPCTTVSGGAGILGGGGMLGFGVDGRGVGATGFSGIGGGGGVGAVGLGGAGVSTVGISDSSGSLAGDTTGGCATTVGGAATGCLAATLWSAGGG